MRAGLYDCLAGRVECILAADDIPVKTHQDIDRRSLLLAGRVAAKVDEDASILARVGALCRRWATQGEQPAVLEWLRILQEPWPTIRALLLEDSERGRRLRQSSPFCGILTPEERWQIYRYFAHEKTGS